MTRHFTGIQMFSVSEPPAPVKIDWQGRQPDGMLQVASTPGAFHRTDRIASVSSDGPTVNDTDVASATLVFVGGPDDGAIVPVAGGVFTLGRMPNNNMVINDPWVSRNHAEILRTPSEYVLRDLSSSNGTFVNNRNIGQMDHALQDGEQIRLGQSAIQMVFRFAGASTLRIDKSGLMAATEMSASENVPSTLTQIDAVPGQGQVLDGNENLIEGDVRLNVKARGDVRQMFLFVHELRQKPELRVLRLARGPKQDIAIWLGLREVVHLKDILSSMKGVSAVDYLGLHATDPNVPEHVFHVEMSA